jgi:hypothetical protein
MGLDFAIDELYASGWNDLDSTGCTHHLDGRAFPLVERVRDEFRAAGFSLQLKHVQLFDCYRAEWADGAGKTQGAIVGQSEIEAAVYALSQLRRNLAIAS